MSLQEEYAQVKCCPLRAVSGCGDISMAYHCRGSPRGLSILIPWAYTCLMWLWASLVAQTVKNPPAMQETQVRSLGWEDPLATHFSILVWRISRTEEPRRLQSVGFQRVWHDWVINPSLSVALPPHWVTSSFRLGPLLCLLCALSLHGDACCGPTGLCEDIFELHASVSI